MITVVNKYREPNHIYCGRGTALGNPFVMKNDNERDQVCDWYKEWFYKNVDVASFLGIAEADADYDASLNPQTKMLIAIYHEALQGDVNLGCFCAPKRCHCDTIKEFIELKIEESFK